MTAHPPTDPDYLDQMPAREHVWSDVTSTEEGRCWCGPFPYPGIFVMEKDFTLSQVWLHRPHGCVFWEHGEQGPNLYAPLVFNGEPLTVDPTLEDLDRPVVDIEPDDARSIADPTELHRDLFERCFAHEKHEWQKQLSDEQVLKIVDQCSRPMGCTEDGE